MSKEGSVNNRCLAYTIQNNCWWSRANLTKFPRQVVRTQPGNSKYPFFFLSKACDPPGGILKEFTLHGRNNGGRGA